MTSPPFPPLPPHREDGSLPPTAKGDLLPTIASSAPFALTLADFFRLFAVTPHRAELARGLHRMRQRLREVGVVRGFQWIGGSYVRRGGTPRDIDVVTFHETPASWSTAAARKAALFGNPQLFLKGGPGREFGCDARFVECLNPTHVARWSAYWSALFSIDKPSFAAAPATARRVGFVQVSLDSEDERAAAEQLEVALSRPTP